MRLKTWAASATVAVALSGTVAAGADTKSGVKLAGARPVAPATPALPVGAITTAPDGTMTIRVTRGKRTALPMNGVTRIIPADDDVVRGEWNGSKAVIEGVTTGSTLVEIYRGDNQRQLVNVLVEESGAPIASASGGAPAAGAVVSPLPGGAPVTVQANTPVVVADGGKAATRPGTASGPALTASDRARLQVTLRVTPAEDNPDQALFTATYENRSSATAKNVVLRTSLDDAVSYVKGSATGSPRYDAAARELIWNLGALDAGSSSGSVSWRVESIERTAGVFYSAATIEDASGVTFTSNSVNYTPNPTALLTVFALPDRFLAGRNAPVLTDVRGLEYESAIDRLQRMGVVTGTGPNTFNPKGHTKRGEYAVMTLNGLGLKDLRDASAIKFVLSRRAQVTLNILNSRGQLVQNLVKKNTVFNKPGEYTVTWDGRSAAGYAPPGRYTYECTVRDTSNSRGETNTLRGVITIVPQVPVAPVGVPTYIDVKPTDWYSGYLAVAQKQGLMIGLPGRRFEPLRSINRVEATAVVVRALGLEDLARRSMSLSNLFLDDQDIPSWAVGYVSVASTVAKTAGGKLIVGYPDNRFLPMRPLRRDEAALIVQRLIDKETNRRVAVSGAMVPGAMVTINGRSVETDPSGNFAFVIEQNTAEAMVLSVTQTR